MTYPCLKTSAISREITPMHSARFSLSCLVVTLSAVALLAISAGGVWDDYASVAKPYGTGVVAAVVFLIPVQFILSTVYKIYRERGTTLSQTERLAWYKSYLRNYPWLNVLVATVALIATLSSFTVYKGSVVGAQGYGFDAMFIAWDRVFFAGNDGWVVTHSIFNTAAATMWIDFLYHPTFFPMLLVYLLAITSTGLTALRQTYILAYLASWVVIGMIGASTLHSAGPVFDGVLYGDGSTFGPLIDRLQAQLDAGGGPVTAAPIREYLLYLHENGEIRFGGGISAMPSMHMVLVYLWVFPAWNLNRIFGMIVALYAGIIWIGSVHLGWHYFVDGLVSLVVVGIIWRIAGHIVGLYGQPQVIRATT